MAEERAKPARIADFQPGEYWMVTHPSVRLIRVERATTVEQISPPSPTGGVSRATDEPALEVLATVPETVIEGFVDQRKAKQGANIRRGLVAMSEDSDYDHRVWRELWSERVVGQLVRNKGGVLEVADDGRVRMQLYVAEVRDTTDAHNGRGHTLCVRGGDPEAFSTLTSSGLLGSEIKATKIAKSRVKGDPFALPPVGLQEGDAT